jgi:hypothetical protein
MDKRLQDAINNVDKIISQVNLPRVAHLQLIEDLNLIVERVKLSYQIKVEKEKKDNL